MPFNSRKWKASEPSLSMGKRRNPSDIPFLYCCTLHFAPFLLSLWSYADWQWLKLPEIGIWLSVDWFKGRSFGGKPEMLMWKNMGKNDWFRRSDVPFNQSNDLRLCLTFYGKAAAVVSSAATAVRNLTQTEPRGGVPITSGLKEDSETRRDGVRKKGELQQPRIRGIAENLLKNWECWTIGRKLMVFF